MATITGTIKENGTAVGAGWQLIYGDSGSGIKTTCLLYTSDAADE